MEDEDDEFGELYADVLQPLSSSPKPPQALFSSATQPPNLNPLANHDQSLYGPLNPAKTVHQTLVSDLHNRLEGHIHGENNVTNTNLNNKVCVVQEQVDNEQQEEKEMESKVLNGLDTKSNDPNVIRVLENRNGLSLAEPLVEVKDGGVAEDLEFDVEFELKEQEAESRFLNFQGLDPKLDVIRVLENGDKESLAEPVDMRALDPERDCGTGTQYDKDSESEDDLKIILNDDDSSARVGVNENGVGIDEMEAGEDLVTVAENDLGVEEKVLGEDLAEMGDWETKETFEGVKGCGELGNAVRARIGYQDHSCHSAFKSVRPVALAMPGRSPMGPGGASCQVHPFVNYVRPLAAAMSGGAPIGPGGAPGIKSALAVLKSSPGFLGASVRGNNSSGHGPCNRFEFMLPSHMTIFDISIDNFGEKPWRHPGVDLSDFFKFGLDEEKWKDYCKQMEQLRLDSSKQIEIINYGSGRLEQRNDPYPPPDLAAATRIHDQLAENLSGRTDVVKSELLRKGMGVAHELSPIPIGRAIPVEVSVGERLPSIDAKPPRLRNSDAIIEIVLQDSVDDKDIDGEDFKEDVAQMDTKRCSFHPHNCNTQSSTHKNIHGDGILPFPLDGSHQYWPGFEQSAGIFGTLHDERRAEDLSHDKFIHIEHDNDEDPSQNGRGKKLHSVEGDEMASEEISPSETLKDKSLFLSNKKPKLRSRVKQLIHNIVHEDDFRVTHSIKNKKVRSGTNGDEHLFLRRDDCGQEGSQDMDQNSIVEEGKDLHSHRDWDPNSACYSSMGFDKRKERRMRIEDAHKKRVKDDDMIKATDIDGMRSSHNKNVQETERNNINLHVPPGKKMGSHSWSDHDRNLGPRHGRSVDTLNDLCKCLYDPHARRRKDEEHLSGENANKKEFLHGYRTRKDSSCRKRERDDCLDQTRKDKNRIRDRPDYHRSGEHSEERWQQKGRNDRPRLKQTHEDNLSERVREGRRTGGYRSSCSDCSANMSDTKGMNSEEHKKIRTKSNHKNVLSPTKEKKYDHRSYSNEKVSMEGSKEQASENSLKTDPTDSCDPGQLKSLSAAFTKKVHHGQEIPKQCCSSKQREDAISSNREQDLKRGRSKLERWTSHDERDEDSIDSLDNQTNVDEERIAGDLGINIGEDAEKLKKRSNRFKLPVPNVKDLRANRTMESESIALIQNETAADSDIKHERPA